MNDATKTNVLKWFSGKALVNAKEALALLEESEKSGGWLPKSSRTVRARLTKHNVAQKFARKHQDQINRIGAQDGFRFGPGSALTHAMLYGFREVNSTQMADAVLAAKTQEEKDLLHTCIGFLKDFYPVVLVIRELDRTRPKPVFTFLGVSPTITATLTDMGMDLDLNTIRVCPGDWKRIDGTDKHGKLIVKWVYVLVFPAGTIHNASRYGCTNNNVQCQACGHAIKNPFNWVPVLVDSKAGIPHSLFVGRDCAKSVFGIDMDGELEIKR